MSNSRRAPAARPKIFVTFPFLLKYFRGNHVKRIPDAYHLTLTKPSTDTDPEASFSDFIDRYFGFWLE